MRRRSFTFVSITSLITCCYLIAGAAQGWTYSATTYVYNNAMLDVERGGLIHFGSPGGDEWKYRGGGIDRQSRVLGFRYFKFQNQDRGEDWMLDVPYWPFIVLTAVLPAVWAAREGKKLRERHREGHGQCTACGYNLTGNTSGVCPECGTPVPKKAGAMA